MTLHTTRCLALAVLSMAANLALAQETAPRPAVPAQAQAEAADRDLLYATCADYLTALSIANPGDKATAQQKVDAEEAQDDIVGAVMWVHGYTSGKQAGGSFPPLTQAWMRDTVVRLAKTCKEYDTGGKMLLVEAAIKP